MRSEPRCELHIWTDRDAKRNGSPEIVERGTISQIRTVLDRYQPNRMPPAMQAIITFIKASKLYDHDDVRKDIAELERKWGEAARG